MLPRAVYVIGGAGVGKSTFMEKLLDLNRIELGPLEDLHAQPNAAGNVVTLRGHTYTHQECPGVYLGLMRDQFPGSDGLDRASSMTGSSWAYQKAIHYDTIIGEGATLATRPFLFALSNSSDLLVIALRCDPVVHDLRLLQRGSGQAESFITSTVTKTRNLAADLEKIGASVIWVDTDDPASWEDGLGRAVDWLNPVL